MALCQINTVPGDVPGNLGRILHAAREAEALGADLAVFPELCIEGYSPRDLLRRPAFLQAAAEARVELAHQVSGPALLIGTVLPNEGPGRALHNGAVLIEDGKERARFLKTLLPDYDVFDEARYFEPGKPGPVVDIAGCKVGVTICEDIWARVESAEAPRYTQDPVEVLRAAGAEVIVNLSASPYGRDRPAFRERLAQETARRADCAIVLCNLVGGNDEILFDGASTAVNAGGDVIARAPIFERGVVLADLGSECAANRRPQVEEAEELRQALVMGIRDYARKCGFQSVHFGLSGGVDSAVVAALAVDALGASKVRAVAFPSGFSSPESEHDARELSELLGIRFDTIPIESAYHNLVALARQAVGEGPFGVMEENIQARIRGLLLMAISNRTGSLLLSTGNKSEMAVGYCTLYGDMSGGLAVVSDVLKTDVYALARLYRRRGVMPERILTKAPSAELRPDQKDEDTLPPYERLDRILALHVEGRMSHGEILDECPDLDSEEVAGILSLVARNEYKRKQAPPGLRVTTKAFGFGRRIPIVAGNLDFLNQAEKRAAP